MYGKGAFVRDERGGAKRERTPFARPGEDGANGARFED